MEEEGEIDLKEFREEAAKDSTKTRELNSCEKKGAEN